MSLRVKKEIYVHTPAGTTLYVEYEQEGEFTPLPRYKEKYFAEDTDYTPLQGLAAAILQGRFLDWQEADYQDVLQAFLR